MSELNKALSQAVRQITPEAVSAAVGPLAIPHEDDGGDTAASSALSGRGPITIRRPDREDWVILNREAAIRVYLARVQVPERFDVEYFYVPKESREGLEHTLRPYHVVPYYSTLRRRCYLHVCSLDGENGWADSLHVLFNQPADWYAQHAVRVVSNREEAKYVVYFKPTAEKPNFPAEGTDVLLGEALGSGRIVTGPEHPKYGKILNTGEVLI